MQTLEQLKSGQLMGTKKLKLSCGLTEFPLEILELHETLEVLDLSGNNLTDLPEDFRRLQHLKIAFFSNNDFTRFPAVLGQCPSLEMIGFKACHIAHIPENALPQKLRWLILTDNQLAELPASIGRCTRLQKCMLAGNKLTTLPPQMASCRNLELLRISANAIEALPDWLLTLPRLSWLAFAGNLLLANSENRNSLSLMNWTDFVLDEQLGEGASGIIAKAHWQGSNSVAASDQVAVKVFKGEVTSDGLPQHEMAACMAAGAHPNLVQVLGRIQGHPEQKQGLVLGLIPPAYRNLGGPPNFETCTRDTYPAGTAFSISHISRIATGIASAAAHLHARGIMHGDLYAHNTLIDAAAHPLLGDFGAATIYEGIGADKATALERLEVRAFGCLLEDLLTHLAPADAQHESIPMLTMLKEDCMNPAVNQRPDFRQICARLEEAIPNHW